MRWIYALGVLSYTLAVKIVSLWNPKAKKWLDGRKKVWRELDNFHPDKTVYWFHCASLGEFEQGRPIMERLKSKEDCQIVVTFFSPSGYDIRKDYENADLVTYLPVDSRKNAARFIEKIKPSKVFFIKYEFWANYILYCSENEIPIYSVSALFREHQIFFKAHGGFLRKVLSAFDQIFVQNEASKELLKQIDLEAIVSGDTRFDRVMKNVENVQVYEEVESFVAKQKTIICGSIWQDDLDVIHHHLSKLKGWKIIVAPHQISDNFINQIERKISQTAIRYSNIDNFKDEQMLIIDNIGMLMNLYQYGDIAYVGGGFKTGLHNILEPAAFGLPVIFGNKVDKFPEAQLFIDHDIGFKVENRSSFEETFETMKDEKMEAKVLAFMKSQEGATEIILNHVK